MSPDVAPGWISRWISSPFRTRAAVRGLHGWCNFQSLLESVWSISEMCAGLAHGGLPPAGGAPPVHGAAGPTLKHAAMDAVWSAVSLRPRATNWSTRGSAT